MSRSTTLGGSLRFSREELDAAVDEALARHADVLYPFDRPRDPSADVLGGLTADERAALEEGGVCFDELPEDAEPRSQGMSSKDRRRPSPRSAEPEEWLKRR